MSQLMEDQYQGGVAGAPGPIKVPTPEIIAARDDLAHAAQLLEECLDELAMRLVPVLPDPRPMDAAPDPLKSTETELGAHLVETTARIVRQAERVRDLRERVAL